MADLKTTQEAAAATLTGSELVRGVQSGGNVKMTTQAIADLGYASPGSAKGDMIVHVSGADQRLPVGANGAQLVADSTQTLGVKWFDALGAFVSNLATSAGATLIGFIQSGTGAILRTMQAKARDQISVTDFTGADPSGVSDSTGAINLATVASATYGSALYRRVDVPGGNYKVGGSNAGAYVRKGQKLHGAGMGTTVFDASASGSNTVPTVTLGTSSSNVPDSGGQVVEVSSLQFLGGPSAYANIDTTACAGWSIHDAMFSSPGIGVVAGGADGILQGCLFDDGLNGLVINGANILVSACNFYLANYQCTANTGTYDVAITGCQFEYPKFASILLGSGATGQKNIIVRDCNFIQNAQFGTFQGAIFITCNGADMLVSVCTFRNLNGAGIKYSTGVGNVVVVEGCIFDGNKTTAGYSQSTTMQGVDATNMVTTIRGSTFRNLPGQPITFGGGEISTLIVEGCDFSGNTGGTTEINITNSNGASLVVISGCTGSGRPLVNNQSIVPVVYMQDNRDGADTELTFVTASTSTVGVAAQSIIANFAGTVTLTLPPAAIFKNRRIAVRTITANAVVSASSNVAPIAGGAAGTAILSAAAGKWASLRSDGTNWQIESSN